MNFFEKINKLEENNNLPEAINLSVEVLKDKNMQSLHKIIKPNLQRIIDKVDFEINKFWKEPLVVYQTERNPNTYLSDIKYIKNRNFPPLISLTTISGRLERLKKTIKSILEQGADIHSINLYISDTPYLLDKGIDKNSNELIEIYNMGVNIYCVPNTGPYRKQIPIVYQLKKLGADPLTPIITMDDDVIYPNNIVERLMAIKNHDFVVSHRGRTILLNKDGISNYADFSVPTSHSNYLNLGTGKNGILYRLGFFPDSIRGYFGPIIAPTADDLWCKWITACRCIPTEVLEPQAAFDSKLDFIESDPKDKNSLFHSFNSKGSNNYAIQSLENYFYYKFGHNLFSIYSYLGDKK